MSRIVDKIKRQSLAVVSRLNGIAKEAIVEGIYPWKTAHPASFKSWVRRSVGRSTGDFPSSWRIDARFPFAEPSAVAVVLHVYYPDLVEELLDRLTNIPVPFDVIVTNASGTTLSEEMFKVGLAANTVVLDVENRGRDIFPLVQVVNAGLLDPYRAVLKVHTKKSAWREGHADLGGSGETWKDAFLDELVGTQDRVQAILETFAERPGLGCVTAPGNVLGREFWGGDQYLTEQLGRRMELLVDEDDLCFAAGSMYWIRAFLLQGLRGLSLTRDDFEEEAGQIDGTTAHAVERLLGILTLESGLSIETTGEISVADPSRELWRRFSPDAKLVPSARFVPFYLPQFHPSDANDLWWGKGFTEWTNVSNAKPNFPGHRQPLLPGDLGFYDLRFDEVRTEQAALARWSGIAGFMYYYYWFAGERLLNLPIERLHAQTDLDQPYCLMWANENWTRAWDGRDRDLLIGQDYDRVPAEDFIDDVAEFLLDPRYMRMDGKAILAVYRPAQMDNFVQVVEAWRERARELGIGELLLLSVEVAQEFDGLQGAPSDYGLDGSLGFPPHAVPWKPGPAHVVGLDPRFRGNLVSYRETAKGAIDRSFRGHRDYFPGVMVSFDNTARRQWRPDVWWGSNPYTFHRWLREAARSVAGREPQERIVFINAWNEWAESAVLEPTQRWGMTYLQAVRNVAFS